VADVPVSLLGLTLPALTFALTIDRILNGLCRPFFGWVSDNIGRENTMFIAFLLEGVGILALANLGTNPVLFVILSGIVFFGWGEIYSLFPPRSPIRSARNSPRANAGLMYTAKGTARPPRTLCQRAVVEDRQLASGVHAGRRLESGRSGDGDSGAEADARLLHQPRGDGEPRNPNRRDAAVR